jgi:hypothetical protein
MMANLLLIGNFKGPQGGTGPSGKGISSTAVAYQSSASGSTVPTGTWSSSIPSISEGQYLWTRLTITYSDSTTTTCYAVGMAGSTGSAAGFGTPTVTLNTNVTEASATVESSGPDTAKVFAFTFNLPLSGTSLPTGGTTGQVLAKASDTSGDAAWVDPPVPSGGTTGQVLAKNSDTSGDVGWVTPSASGESWSQLCGFSSAALSSATSLDKKLSKVGCSEYRLALDVGQSSSACSGALVVSVDGYGLGSGLFDHDLATGPRHIYAEGTPSPYASTKFVDADSDLSTAPAQLQEQLAFPSGSGTAGHLILTFPAAYTGSVSGSVWGLGGRDSGNLPEHDTLAEYTAAELSKISADLSKNGTSSLAYQEFLAYMTAGATWTTPALSGLTDFPSADQVMVCRIVGINHDTKTSGGTAGLTFQATHALPWLYQMNSTNANAGGWSSSKLRATMNSGEIWNMLPSELQDVIVAVDKTTNNTGGTATTAADATVTSDKLWLLSYMEYVPSCYSSWANFATGHEGTQYEYWKGKVTANYSGNSVLTSLHLTNSGAAAVTHEGTAYASIVWERSPYPTGAANFLNVGSNGDPSNGSNASNGLCVVPGFSL